MFFHQHVQILGWQGVEAPGGNAVVAPRSAEVRGTQEGKIAEVIGFH